MLEARSEDEGDDPAADDHGQEAQDELLAQGTVMEPTARILADRHLSLGGVPNISPGFGDSQLSFRGTRHPYPDFPSPDFKFDGTDIFHNNPPGRS